MSRARLMLAEFERAQPLTRTHLERVPEDRLGWKPAEKSMSLGQLALHIAESPGKVLEFGLNDQVDLPEWSEFPQAEGVSQILEAWDATVATLRKLLPDVSDAQLEGTISFLHQGAVVMQFPRGDFLRDIMLNHTYHHRGQMSVYLRELGVAVPPSFGPTADESLRMPA